METFVDPRYFAGTCYQAAGWLCLGSTRGFAKRSQGYEAHGHPKLIFVRPLQRKARQWLADPTLPLKLPGKVTAMKLSLAHAEELLERLRQIPDPRWPRGIRHQKLAILAIAICALISGAKSFKAMAEWAQRCTPKMLPRLDCRYHRERQRFEPPSEPTMRRLLQTIDATAVDQALSGWLQKLDNRESYQVAVIKVTLSI